MLVNLTLWPFKSLQKKEQSGQTELHSVLSCPVYQELDAFVDMTTDSIQC